MMADSKEIRRVSTMAERKADQWAAQ